MPIRTPSFPHSSCDGAKTTTSFSWAFPRELALLFRYNTKSILDFYKSLLLRYQIDGHEGFHELLKGLSIPAGET